jgi:hypothetical protein
VFTGGIACRFIAVVARINSCCDITRPAGINPVLTFCPLFSQSFDDLKPIIAGTQVKTSLLFIPVLLQSLNGFREPWQLV